MKNGLNIGWKLLALMLATLVLIPIIVVVCHLPFIDQETLTHLMNHLLPRYIIGSLTLLLGVLCLSAFLGISTAYLIAFYRFFGSQIFEIALILPLAIPAYIMGFVWVNLFDYESVIPQLLGLDYRIDIMNTSGAIVILSFALYPYVYFFVKNTFMYHMGSLILSAQTLSDSGIKIFFKVILPACRVSMVGALLLVGMETLSDYGLVAYFGIDVFSAGIFRVWLVGGDEVSGIALSAVLVCFVLILVLLEGLQRGHRGYAQKVFLPTPKKTLSRLSGFLAFLWCFIVLFCAFVVPMVWLLYWGFYDILITFPKFIDAMIDSFSISIICAFLIVWIAYYLTFVVRVEGGGMSSAILKVSSLGYAIPGAVVALGILIFSGFINKGLILLDISYAFGGGFFMLFLGYLVRFLASSLFALQAGYVKIPRHLDHAAFSLKSSPARLFMGIHFPLLKPTLVLAFIIIVIDILKELPISMVLAPFGFETLAVMAFEYGNNEQIYDAALPSVLIVLFGLIPVLLMHYLQARPIKDHG